MPQTTHITVLGQRSEGRHPLDELRSPPAARSLYIHVPFCFHKCHYCDFYSFVDSQDRQGEFARALIVELERLSRHAAPLRTIFVGGGTPSLLRLPLWVEVLDALDRLFGLSAFREAVGNPGSDADPDAPEFTVECNPETVTPELMALFASRGVTRVSVGAQSFDQRHLKTLERWHDPENVGRALELAASAGIRRRSLDLIFAVPGQSLEDWRRDLERALAITPELEHLSCYGLTYEPNTAMTQRLGRGEFQRSPEDLEADMYALTVGTLRDRGLERYEVSNFARPGKACRHNLAYWRQHDWLAAGPSASAHVGGWRWKNVPRLGDWLAGIEKSRGLSPVVDVEPPDARRALAERIMTALRLEEGLDREETRSAAEALGGGRGFERAIARHVERENLLKDPRRLRLSDRGFLFADGVAGDLMAALSSGAAPRE